MNPKLWAAGALLAAAAALLSADLSVDRSPDRPLSPRLEHQGCKPDAPVRVELAPEDLVRGRARVDYIVAPVVDALDVEVSIELPQGGAVLSHARPLRGAATRGTELSGSALVALPDLAGVEVEIRAYIHVPDPDAPNGVGIYSTARRVTWGEVERKVEGVVEVRSGGEITLDTNATRL